MRLNQIALFPKIDLGFGDSFIGSRGCSSNRGGNKSGKKSTNNGSSMNSVGEDSSGYSVSVSDRVGQSVSVSDRVGQNRCSMSIGDNRCSFDLNLGSFNFGNR